MGMKETIRICGDNVAKGDWVVLAYDHPHGPVLGIVGRVRNIAVADPDGRPDHNPWIQVSTNAEPVHLKRSEIVSLCVIDGPHLTRDDMRSIDATLVDPVHARS